MVAVPSLSSKVDPEVKRAILSIITQLTGVLNGTIPVGYANTSGTTTTVSGGDTTVPTAPANLVATGAFNYIILEWDHGDDEELIAGFEIWRATVNDIAQAVKVGWTPAKIYTDIPSDTSSAITYYYWVRAVSISDIAGPFNAAAGTSASTATDPEYVLQVLAGQVSESELTESLNERINLISGSGQQFDSQVIWYFDSGIDGFSGNGVPTATNGWLDPADHATDPYVITPTDLGINGTIYGFIMIRIRKTGTPVWEGRIYWQTTADSTWDVARSVTVSEPSYDGNNIGLLNFDTNWTGTIKQVRIDLSDDQSGTDYFEIDWVSIGRPSPGASTASVTAEQTARINGDNALAADIVIVEASIDDVSAAVSAEETARINGDSAIASDVGTLQTTVGDHTTAIQTNATSIDGVEAQYTVKIDNNGVMSGFGLASTIAKGGVPFSEFYALADRFAIINPPVTPKVVTSITRTDTTATMVCDSHGFVTGEMRLITNAAQGEYNGIHQMTVIDPDTVTYPVAVTAVTPATVASGFTNILAGETPAKVPFIVQSGIVYMDTAMIEDATITNAKIGALAVDTAKIANLAVTDAKIGNATITGAKIASATITAANITNATITGAKIASATINNANIANAAITEAKIETAAVTTAKIADADITTLKIAGNAVTIPVSAYTATSTYMDDGVLYTLQYINMTTGYSGTPVVIIASFKLTSLYPSTAITYLYRNTTLVYSATNITVDGTRLICFTVLDTPGSSGVIYYLKIKCSASYSDYIAVANEKNLIAIGCKR